MEIIPVIKMERRKILGENTKQLLEKLENKVVYILDLDGIEKDKPNLCTFQRMASSYDLWLDFGPRDLGDVVDAFMAGADRVTIREGVSQKITIEDIREISENEVFINIELGIRFLNNSDGFVNFNSKERIESDLRYHDLINQLKTRGKLYSYETDMQYIGYWERLGVKGLLVDIDKFEEFDKWLQK